jgi:outer membrane protein TolC
LGDGGTERQGGAWKTVAGLLLSDTDALEEKVTAANRDLKAAVAWFDEAGADAQTVQAGCHPTLDASGSAIGNHHPRHERSQ